MTYGIRLEAREPKKESRYNPNENDINDYSRIERQYETYQRKKETFESTRESTLYSYGEFSTTHNYKDSIDNECDPDIPWYN